MAGLSGLLRMAPSMPRLRVLGGAAHLLTRYLRVGRDGVDEMPTPRPRRASARGAVRSLGHRAIRARWWLAAAGVASVSLVVLPGWRDPVVVGLAVVGGCAGYAARWHLAPLAVVAVVGIAVAGVWPAAFLTTYLVALRASRPATAAWAACAVAAAATGASLPGASGAVAAPADAATSLVTFLVVPLVVGWWVRERRRVLAGLRDQNERLRRERAAEVARERARERTRIAREMHDVVAHKVSLMAIHAGAIDVRTSEPATRAEAQLVQGLGREAMRNLRDVLAVLREDPPASGGTRPAPGLADVEALVEHSRRAGLTVACHHHGTPRCVPEAVGAALYRVVQEALTNVHRHAGDVAVQVRFTWSSRLVEVTIRNQAGDGAPDLRGSGLGLVGLRERVAALGGSFAAGPPNPADGSFEVSAALPLEAPHTGAEDP